MEFVGFRFLCVIEHITEKWYVIDNTVTGKDFFNLVDT